MDDELKMSIAVKSVWVSSVDLGPRSACEGARGLRVGLFTGGGERHGVVVV